MASNLATATVEPELGDKEFPIGTQDAQDALQNCSAQALEGMSVSDKNLLKQKTEETKDLVDQAVDALVERRNRNNVEVELLQSQVAALSVDRDTVIQFLKVYTPVSDSCADAAEAAGSTKTLTDKLFTDAIELNYRISIKQLIDGKIGIKITKAEKVIEKLDELLYLLNQ